MSTQDSAGTGHTALLSEAGSYVSGSKHEKSGLPATPSTPPSADTDRTSSRLSRIERAKQPHARQVMEAVALHHGVCVRPVAMRKTNLATGETNVVALPCGATKTVKCPPCAERAKQLRIQQCREGWHLDQEPDLSPDEPDPSLRPLLEYRATLEEALADARAHRDEADIAELEAEIADLADMLHQLGVRGHIPVNADKPRRTRSTRHRQDTPDLPFVKVEHHTVGKTYVGKNGAVHRPSTFLTLTCDTYGPIRAGVPINPATYDYRRAARDAIHFSKLVDRFWQNLRRVVGYNVQYFACVEPQQRLASHLHAAIRGTFPRRLMKQVVDATYHQVWWPTYDIDRPAYTNNHHPQWDNTLKAYVDPDTRQPLPSWDDALDDLDTDPDAEPVHTVRFGPVMDIKGIAAGSPHARRAIGYLAKYITKDAADCYTATTTEAKAHHARLVEALRYEPCSKNCTNWLRYGIQPHQPKPGMTAGRCKGKAHRPDHLGHAGRRILVSRKWSGKTLTDHKTDRRNHIHTVLNRLTAANPGTGSGHHNSHSEDPWIWEPIPTTEPDHPPRNQLILRAIAHKTTWQHQYRQAQNLAPPETPAIAETAA